METNIKAFNSIYSSINLSFDFNSKFCLKIFIILLMLFQSISCVYADFGCSSLISYEVMENDPNHFEDNLNKIKTQEVKSTEGKAEKDEKVRADDQKNIKTIDFLLLEEKGKDENEAKNRLNKQILFQKTKALETCKSTNLESSQCILKELTLYNEKIARLTFSQKKLLEEKIKQECETFSSKCLNTKSSPPECKEIIVKSLETPVGDTGKDKKGKKK